MSAIENLMGLGISPAVAQLIVSVQFSQEVTGNKTIDASYNGQTIPVKSGSGVTLTFPSSLPTGFGCLILQVGAGQATFSGTTSQQNFTKTAGQGAYMGVVSYKGTNYLFGNGA